MQDKEPKFNWKLPLFGAVGFGVGGVIACIIANIIASSIITETTPWVWAEILGAIGPLCGAALGGAALGLALKDKKKTLYLACTAPLGMVIGFIVTFVPLMLLMIAWAFHNEDLASVPANYDIEFFIILIGIFLMIPLYGLIFGGVIGMVFKNAKKTIYLASAGAIGFAICGAIFYLTGAGLMYVLISPSQIGTYDVGGVIITAIAAAIVGALLGYALAHLARE